MQLHDSTPSKSNGPRGVNVSRPASQGRRGSQGAAFYPPPTLHRVQQPEQASDRTRRRLLNYANAAVVLPAVPADCGMLRFSVMATQTEDEVDRLLEVVSELARQDTDHGSHIPVQGGKLHGYTTADS